MEELKPCPCCGYQDVKYYSDYDFAQTYHYVCCPDCGLTTGGENSYETAAKVWNSRKGGNIMENKEAIEKLKNYEKTLFTASGKLALSIELEMAISALEKVEVLEAENTRLKEKQTPVKIRTETEGIYEPYDDVPIGRKVNLYCGKCGKPLNAYHNYCYWCGQPINNDKE